MAPLFPAVMVTDLKSTTSFETFTESLQEEIHPIWRQQAFRTAHHYDYHSLPDVDMPEYDIPSLWYDRMKPALKLATQFLRSALPEFARILFAPQVNVTLDRHDWVFSSWWTPTWENIQECINHLGEDTQIYRFTLADRSGKEQKRKKSKTIAFTCALPTPGPTPEREGFYIQTALLLRWYTFLEMPDYDWKTMPVDAKYCRYLDLAVALIHELAHAVWRFRFRDQPGVRKGRYIVHSNEPRFSACQKYAELGYAVQIQLFGGLTSFVHYDGQRKQDNEQAEMLVADIQNDGQIVGVHEMPLETVLTFFRHSSWIRETNGFKSSLPIMRLGPNIRRSTAPLPTSISKYDVRPSL